VSGGYFELFERSAARWPDAVAIERLPGRRSPGERITYRELAALATQVAADVRAALGPASVAPGERGVKVGLLAQNGIEWAAADLALALLGATEVPLPLAFSVSQLEWLLRGVDLLIVDEPGARRCAELAQARSVPIVRVHRREPPAVACLDELRGVLGDSRGICKIIHTSGTTSEPKGVRILASSLDVQVESLSKSLGLTSHRYLSLVPFSLLIEQLCALYLMHANGGTTVLLPTGMPEYVGADLVASEYLAVLAAAQPSIAMLPPALVQAIHARARALQADGASGPEMMRALFGRPEAPLLACGGAPTPLAVLAEMQRFGMPVYEGYGLSENTAVATWNAPQAYRPGTVGKPLPHVRARLADDGELLLASSTLCDGYEHEDVSSCPISADGWLSTGDLAQIDEDGFITIRGRKKHLLITAASRKISAEWVEQTYRGVDGVDDVVVFGDALEGLRGLVVTSAETDTEALSQRLEAHARVHLPSYARLRAWTRCTPQQANGLGLYTLTGRPCRDRIWSYIEDSAISAVSRDGACENSAA
jgi:long-subunit acyl-CoA synthetase (AMP-forming)